MPFSWVTANFICHIVSLLHQAILGATCYELFLYLEINRSQIMTPACRAFSKLPNKTLSWWGGRLNIQDLRKQKKLELPQTAKSLDNAKVVGKKNTGSKQIHSTENYQEPARM